MAAARVRTDLIDMSFLAPMEELNRKKEPRVNAAGKEIKE
jgi:hypothetical protein